MSTPRQVLDLWFPEEHCTRDTGGDYRERALDELREALAPEFTSKGEIVKRQGAIIVKRDVNVSWLYEQATERDQINRRIAVAVGGSTFGPQDIVFSNPEDLDHFMEALTIARSQVFPDQN